MIFGIPWYAIVAIIAVAAPFIFSYKEKELKNEEKRLSNSKELNEMRKIIHNLTRRVDQLETDLNAAKQSGKSTVNPLKEIEIEDEPEDENQMGGSPQKTKIH